MNKYRNSKAPKHFTFLPLRVEIHQLGHIITDASFKYNTVFISISVKWEQIKEDRFKIPIYPSMSTHTHV